MGNIDVKKIVIAIILILVLVVGGLFVIKAINNGGKKYTLEQISEEDAKYFEVYSDGKYGVLNEKGEMIVQNIYNEVIIPNPKEPVFICKNASGIAKVISENKDNAFDKYDKIEAISLDGINTHFPYEKSVLRFEKDGKYRTY